MKEIIFLGVGPLPYEKDKTVFGPGVRTFQLIQAIIDAGFKVHLFTIPFGKKKQDKKLDKIYEKPNLTHYSIYSSKYEIINTLIWSFCEVIKLFFELYSSSFSRGRV